MPNVAKILLPNRLYKHTRARWTHDEAVKHSKRQVRLIGPNGCPVQERTRTVSSSSFARSCH